MQEPIGIRDGIIVDEGNDFAGGRVGAAIARIAQSFVGCADELEGITSGDGSAVVAGPVIDNNDLVIGVVELEHTVEALRQRSRPIVGANHHGDFWTIAGLGKWHLTERIADGFQSRLGFPLFVREAKGPVVHFFPAAIPFVRPRKNKQAGASHAASQPDLPFQHFCLFLLAVTQAVEPHLAQDQRPVSGEVLQLGQVTLELLGVFEVDVEAEQVEEGKLQVFGRGVIDVGHDGIRGFLLHHFVDAAKITLDAAGPQPAGYGGGCFVAQSDAQQCRVPGAAAHLFPDELMHIRCFLAVNQVPHILFGREPHHDPEPMVPCHVEQFPRRCCMGDANGVHSMTSHHGEISVNLLQIVIFLLPRIGRERAVGDSLDEELLFAGIQEFAADPRLGWREPLSILQRGGWLMEFRKNFLLRQELAGTGVHRRFGGERTSDNGTPNERLMRPLCHRIGRMR